MLTNEETVDHVQHMRCEEMGVELIESDDDGVDMGPSKMTLVECRESLKGVVLYSIVLCSHVSLRIYNELGRNMHLHVRITCESLVMDVPT